MEAVSGFVHDPALGFLNELNANYKTLLSKGKRAQALAVLQQLYAQSVQQLGADHSYVRSTANVLSDALNNTALTLLRDRCDNAQVFKYLKEAEGLTRPHEPLTAVTFNNLACYYRRQGKLRTALSYLEKALSIENRARAAGVPGINVAGTHMNICVVLSQLDRHSTALEHAQNAVILLQEDLVSLIAVQQSEEQEKQSNSELLNKMSVLAISYHNLGVELEFLKRLQEAVDSYAKGAEIARMYLGADSSVTHTLSDALAAASAVLSRSTASAPTHRARKPAVDSGAVKRRPASATARSSPFASRPTRPASAKGSKAASVPSFKELVKAQRESTEDVFSMSLENHMITAVHSARPAEHSGKQRPRARPESASSALATRVRMFHDGDTRGDSPGRGEQYRQTDPDVRGGGSSGGGDHVAEFWRLLEGQKSKAQMQAAQQASARSLHGTGADNGGNALLSAREEVGGSRELSPVKQAAIAEHNFCAELLRDDYVGRVGPPSHETILSRTHAAALVEAGERQPGRQAMEDEEFDEFTRLLVGGEPPSVDAMNRQPVRQPSRIARIDSKVELRSPPSKSNHSVLEKNQESDEEALPARNTSQSENGVNMADTTAAQASDADKTQRELERQLDREEREKERLAEQQARQELWERQQAEREQERQQLAEIRALLEADRSERAARDRQLLEERDARERALLDERDARERQLLEERQALERRLVEERESSERRLEEERRAREAEAENNARLQREKEAALLAEERLRVLGHADGSGSARRGKDALDVRRPPPLDALGEHRTHAHHHHNDAWVGVDRAHSDGGSEDEADAHWPVLEASSDHIGLPSPGYPATTTAHSASATRVPQHSPATSTRGGARGPSLDLGIVSAPSRNLGGGDGGGDNDDDDDVFDDSDSVSKTPMSSNRFDSNRIPAHLRTSPSYHSPASVAMHTSPDARSARQAPPSRSFESPTHHQTDARHLNSSTTPLSDEGTWPGRDRARRPLSASATAARSTTASSQQAYRRPMSASAGRESVTFASAPTYDRAGGSGAPPFSRQPNTEIDIYDLISPRVVDGPHAGHDYQPRHSGDSSGHRQTAPASSSARQATERSWAMQDVQGWGDLASIREAIDSSGPGPMRADHFAQESRQTYTPQQTRPPTDGTAVRSRASSAKGPRSSTGVRSDYEGAPYAVDGHGCTESGRPPRRPFSAKASSHSTENGSEHARNNTFHADRSASASRRRPASANAAQALSNLESAQQALWMEQIADRSAIKPGFR